MVGPVESEFHQKCDRYTAEGVYANYIRRRDETRRVLGGWGWPYCASARAIGFDVVRALIESSSPLPGSPKWVVSLLVRRIVYRIWYPKVLLLAKLIPIPLASLPHFVNQGALSVFSSLCLSRQFKVPGKPGIDLPGPGGRLGGAPQSSLMDHACAHVDIVHCIDGGQQARRGSYDIAGPPKRKHSSFAWIAGAFYNLEVRGL